MAAGRAGLGDELTEFCFNDEKSRSLYEFKGNKGSSLGRLMPFILCSYRRPYTPKRSAGPNEVPK